MNVSHEENLSIEEMEQRIEEYERYEKQKEIFNGMMVYLNTKEQNELFDMFYDPNFSQSEFADKLDEMVMLAQVRRKMTVC